jgi:hypothetical protein
MHIIAKSELIETLEENITQPKTELLITLTENVCRWVFHLNQCVFILLEAKHTLFSLKSTLLIHFCLLQWYLWEVIQKFLV